MDENDIENRTLSEHLNLLGYVLTNFKDDGIFLALHLAARYLMVEFDRSSLPDWVAVIAGANMLKWRDALEEAKAELRGER